MAYPKHKTYHCNKYQRIYVQNKDRELLMSYKSVKARHLLRGNKATIIQVSLPATSISLLISEKDYKNIKGVAVA